MIDQQIIGCKNSYRGQNALIPAQLELVSSCGLYHIHLQKIVKIQSEALVAGGKMTRNPRLDGWMEGRRHLICHQRAHWQGTDWINNTPAS